MNKPVLTRRAFLGGLAAGTLVVACRSSGPPKMAKGDTTEFSPDIFLTIAPDGTVTIVTHRSEMGTGVRTALPMVVADELGADWDRVSLEQAIGDERYGSQNTDGSRSVRRFYERMQVAGATARTMLERAAAKQWGVEPKECTTRDHAVLHSASNRSLDFKDLVASAATLDVPTREELEFRPSSEYRYVGKKDVPMADLDAIITGKAIYGIDVRREGMLYAVVARSPVHAAPLESFDSEDAKAVPGVVDVVEIPAFKPPHAFQPLGGVAVLANSTAAAIRGRRALKIVWGKSANDSYDSEVYHKELVKSSHERGKVFRNVGDVYTGFQYAAGDPDFDIVEADYYVPHHAQAPMEPPCAAAQVQGNTCEAWAATQNPQASQSAVAQALGIEEKDVTVNVTLLGGGFGRKSKPDYVAEAAVLSRAMGGRPVHVTWTREDDIQHGYYHTVANVHMRAIVDSRGSPRAWLQRSAFPSLFSTFNVDQKYGSDLEMGLGFTDVPWNIKHLRVENCSADSHVRIGWLRSVSHIYHALAICSFADELAHRAKREPLEYLLELIGPDRLLDLEGVEYPNHKEPLDRYPFDTARLRDVTERVAKLSTWRYYNRALPRGEGWGIACHRCFLSYVASVVKVEVSKDGELRIPKVYTVIDAGRVIQPDYVRNQMEGATAFAASLAVHGEITAKNGSIVQSNFDDYQVSRMSDAPREVEVEIVESDALPAGVGEVGVPPFAPALCNAIFAATGKRIRRLPIKQHDLSWS